MTPGGFDVPEEALFKMIPRRDLTSGLSMIDQQGTEFTQTHELPITDSFRDLFQGLIQTD